MKSITNIWKGDFNSLAHQQLTKGQQGLIRKHGSPKEFAIAAWGMVGEISVDEAQVAIHKYNSEFSNS